MKTTERGKGRIAITGATGFVGRHVREELRSRGVNVFDERIDVHSGAADAYERMGAPEVLIHLAWQGLPNYKSPHHLDEELPAQIAFLEALTGAGLKNLLVTGTCFEYGMQSGPLREDMEARPATPYAIAKDLLRQRLEALQSRIGFHLTWARLFYMYGEGQAPGSIYPQLARAARAGDRAFDMSGGEQVRDYLRVEEVARLLVDLALTRRNNGIVNVCSGDPVRLKEIVGSWIKENDWDIQPNLGAYPYPDYEPMEFWGDRTKLESILGNPLISNRAKERTVGGVA